MCRWRKKTDGANRLGNGFRMCAGRCCALSASRRRSALSRHSVGSLLYVSELWAGEMLRSAGCSSGRSFCARGGRSARRCGSLAVFCVRGTPAVRLSRGVLCSWHARYAALSRRGCVLRGEGDSGITKTWPSSIYARASHVVIQTLLCAQSLESDRAKWKRALPAAPQTCAKESNMEAALRPLWTLFIWVAAWVRFTRGGGLRYNEDLTGSDKRKPHSGQRRL